MQVCKARHGRKSLQNMAREVRLNRRSYEAGKLIRESGYVGELSVIYICYWVG